MPRRSGPGALLAVAVLLGGAACTTSSPVLASTRALTLGTSAPGTSTPDGSTPDASMTDVDASVGVPRALVGTWDREVGERHWESLRLGADGVFLLQDRRGAPPHSPGLRRLRSATGSASVDGRTLRLEEAVATLDAYDPAVDDRGEPTLVAVAQHPPLTWHVSGDVLTLTAPDGTTARYRRAPVG